LERGQNSCAKLAVDGLPVDSDIALYERSSEQLSPSG
jgi:hypothetical protein